MAFAPLTKRENWNWHNIISTAEKVNNWKRNRLFKETFFAALLNYEAPAGHEQFKKPIRDIVLKYRPEPEKWWIPEIVEYFYPDYLQSKAGAYFTPKPYCELLGKIAQLYIKPEWIKEGLKVYDPACGVGALLFSFRQLYPEAIIYGQELSPELAAIAQEYLTNRRGGDWNQDNNEEKTGIIKVGDTLKRDKFVRKFHVILANPPFNQIITDKEIIEKYGTKKGNEAWVRQVCRRLKPDGIGIIILPGGILATDGFKEERKRLIKYNWLDAVFYNFYHKGVDGGHKFTNALTDTCFLVLRKRRRSDKLVSFTDCGRQNIEEIINIWQKGGKEKVEITRETIKKNDYNYLGFILRTYDEENGEAIGKLFNWTLSRSTQAQKRTGYYLKVAHKNWEHQQEGLTQEATEIIDQHGQEYLYLWPKDKDNSKILRLKNYLDNRKEAHKAFYQGAIIKHLMRNDFLKWKIDLNNELYTQPREEAEKLTIYDNKENDETEASE